MSKTKQKISLERRTFCAGTLGLAALGPLGLVGCGGGDSSTTTSSGDKTPQLMAAGTFVHPGLLHTQADFDRMSQKVAANASPWIDGWNKLIANSHASLSWTPNPQAIISRGADNTYPDNSAIFFNDVAAAYACALRWKVSGNTAYADKAIQIMNAWSSTLTTIGGISGNPGNDGYLMAGIQGYQFANAGEIMRTYSGWAASDFARFQSMMLNVFYPVNHRFLPSSIVVYSNWDLCCVASIMAIGVLCDNQSLFDEAVTYFKSGLGNGCVAQTVYYLHPGYLGQTQESGRDQGHNTLSISLLTVICEMAWNQGVDLYGYDNNRVLAGAEYVAKGNLIQSGTTYYSVPFATYVNHNTTDTVFSTVGQGTIRPMWSMIYNHYVNRKGLDAPYCKKFTDQTQPEGGGGNYGTTSGGYDQLGYGTLTYTRDPIASGAVPSGLTASVTSGQVTLSWWGTAYATSYNVKRSITAGGPYTTIATGISDLLTYTDSGLAAGTYYYVVTAMTPTGETAASNEAKAFTAVRLHTYLTFDEGSGTSAADSSGNGHAGTLVNAAWTVGKKSNAVSLNGSNGYVSLPAGAFTDLGDFTIATWVYWNASSSQVEARIFDFGWDINHYMCLIPHCGGANVLRFAFTLDGIDGEQRINGTAELPYGQWVHVAVTVAGSVGTLYVNGSAVGSNTAMRYAPFRLGSTSQNWIGRAQYSNKPYFNGKVDDFRIYTGALSATEIAALSMKLSSPLPSPMSDADVNWVGLAGSAAYSNGVYTVAGSGWDIWSNADAFNFASTSITGDATITARVVSQSNTNEWAKAGVMMRSGLDGNASHVMVMITPANGVQMAYRTSAGDPTSWAGSVPGIAAPYWVRLTRTGGTFTGFVSPDGVNWTQVGSVSFGMPSPLLAGLAVTAHDNQLLNVATFDNVALPA